MEYLIYLLCKEFHCLPSQLAGERLDDLLDLIACHNVAGQVRKMG